MADVIDFLKFMEERERQDRFSTWFARFGYVIEPGTSIRDLPDPVLLCLAEGGVQGGALLDELIMYVWGEPKADPRTLPLEKRMRLIDISLFLIDNLRFECMLRLGWIGEFPARSVSIIELIGMGDRERKALKVVPQLTERHPQFHRFRQMLDMEKEGFLRRMIPSVLELYRRMVKGGRD